MYVLSLKVTRKREGGLSVHTWLVGIWNYEVLFMTGNGKKYFFLDDVSFSLVSKQFLLSKWRFDCIVREGWWLEYLYITFSACKRRKFWDSWFYLLVTKVGDGRDFSRYLSKHTLLDVFWLSSIWYLDRESGGLGACNVFWFWKSYVT